MDGVGDFDTMVLEQGAKVSELTLGLGLGKSRQKFLYLPEPGTKIPFSA